MFEKKLILILLIILVFPTVSAQSELDFQIIEVRLDGDVMLDYQTSRSRLDYFSADLKLFPKSSYREDIVEFKLLHKPSASVIMKNNIEYKWDDDTDLINFGYESKVKVWNRIFQIPADVPLASIRLMKEHMNYVRETELVDINNEIREKAIEITKGSDSLYDATFKLAEWVRTNVKYDLNTLTEEATQKSSWVLENKIGVCDEITNLFVSFLRSMNIPVRYVVGIAYSDAVLEGWAPHAWAEVYFQGYGWIPWDVTFGQYGWVDTGHVKLNEGISPNDPSVEYNWKAVKVGLKEKNLELNTSIIEKGDKILPLIELKADAVFDKVKGGSFVPLEVTVKNLQNYYLSTLVYVTSAPGIIGEDSKAVLLKPYEEKKINWILSVPDLNGDFTYKSEVKVAESFGSESRDEILIDDKFEFRSKNDAEKLLSGAELNLTKEKNPEGELETELLLIVQESELIEEVDILARILKFLDNLF